MNPLLKKKYSVVTKVDKKLSYCSTSANINFEILNIRDRLNEMADTYPDKVVFIFNRNNGLKLTYSNIRDKSTLFAKNLLNLGIKKGDRIAYLMPNTNELLLAYFAAALIGAVSVPLDPDYGSDELEYMLKKTDPKCVIIYNCPEYKQMINDLFSEIDSCSKEEFKSAKFKSLSYVIMIDDHQQRLENNHKGTWSYNKMSKNLLEDINQEFPYIDSDDLFGIFFTSGTTGKPKGVMVTQHAALNCLQVSFKKEHFEDEKFNSIPYVLCQSLLMYHLGTAILILATCLVPNITVIFPSYKFNLDDILSSIEKYKCNSLSTLSKILLNLINHPRRIQYNLESLKIVNVGGQLVTSNLIQLLKDELKVKYLNIGYGMTESIGISAMVIDTDNFDGENFDNSLGRPNYPFAEVKIVNPQNGQIQPLNVEGELHTRSYFVTKGYYDDLEQTQKAIDSNGWYKTGDIVSIDETGCLHFKSRSKEIITAKGSGRLDVYPSNVEDCLIKHPNVKEAVVFGVPINDYEQEVCAWVKLKENSENIFPEDLINYCKDKLVDYKVPSYLKFVEDFPVNRMGKYLRTEMQRIYKLELKLYNFR